MASQFRRRFADVWLDAGRGIGHNERVKRIVILVLVLSLGFGGVGVVAAAPNQAAAPASSASAHSAKLSTEKVAQVQSLGNRMANRMQAAINRMQKLVERVQSRVTILKSQGKDVTKFSDWITTINTNIGSAQTALGKFRVDLSSFSTTSDPAATVKQLQMDAKLVKDALVAALTTMKQVAQALVTS